MIGLHVVQDLISDDVAIALVHYGNNIGAILVVDVQGLVPHPYIP